MNKNGFHCLLAGVVLIVLGGCSAGGGETGTGQDTVTVGVITGFGSVFVNGIEYETDASSITLDGTSSLETDLKVGMVVTLAGDVNADGTTGNALSISFNDNVEGMVLENTVTVNNQLSILGQTIVIDSFDTIFESSVIDVQSFAQIEVGNIVEVSGHTSGDGTIYATRVEVKQKVRASGAEVELEGLVSNATTTSFNIGSMTILYSADVLKDFDSVDLKNGNFVEVKSISDLDVSGQLLASEVKLKEQHEDVQNLSSDKEIALEGVITSVESSTQFSLNGQVIIHDDSTEINDVASIVAGKNAKVEGRVNENNEIVAKQIEIKSESKTKIEGLITAINVEAKTVTVFGDEITVTNSTTLRDERDDVDEDARHFFNFADLSVGDNIEVSYYLDTDSNKLLAIKLELEDVEVDDDSGSDDNSGEGEQENEWDIKDTITAYDSTAHTITMLNRTIDISNIDDFIGEAAIGELAEVRGVVTNGIWVATELEVRTEEDDPAGKQENEDDDL